MNHPVNARFTLSFASIENNFTKTQIDTVYVCEFEKIQYIKENREMQDFIHRWFKEHRDIDIEKSGYYYLDEEFFKDAGYYFGFRYSKDDAYFYHEYYE